VTTQALARLLLAGTTIGTLIVPLGDHHAPHLTPEKIQRIASAYVSPLDELLLERCVPRARLMQWARQADHEAGRHGRHEEPPHAEQPEHDPTPLPAAAYSVTGVAAESYAFRLRLPGEE
jgi:hypothetical protein